MFPQITPRKARQGRHLARCVIPELSYMKMEIVEQSSMLILQNMQKKRRLTGRFLSLSVFVQDLTGLRSYRWQYLEPVRTDTSGKDCIYVFKIREII